VLSLLRLILKGIDSGEQLLNFRFVQQNRLRDIPDLGCLPILNMLNINNNEVVALSGLDKCKLETLLCAHNQLSSLDSVAHLAHVTTLQTIDLQNNKIDDPQVLDVFKQIPSLKCLYLKGNPVVSMISNYRCADCCYFCWNGMICVRRIQRGYTLERFALRKRFLHLVARIKTTCVAVSGTFMSRTSPHNRLSMEYGKPQALNTVAI
jgi:hypothetical protein